MEDLLERSHSTDPNDWPIFSYSQLQSWDRCEMQWNYGYIRKWTKVSDHWNFGTEIHMSLAYWYELAIARVPKEKRFPLMEKYFSERVDKVMAENPAHLPIISRCMWLTMRYCREYAPVEDSGHKILAAEHHFTVPFQTGNKRNFILQGYIDLLTSYQGKLWAWDHKSSEGQFWTPTECMMESQTPLYCAALREQGMNVHGQIINQINSYDYKKPHEQTIEKLFRREKNYRTEKELDTIVRELKFTVDDLIEKYDMPRRSLRKDCGKHCAFQEPCLMSMKGIDDLPFLMADFIHKEEHEVELKLDPERVFRSA